MKKQFLTAAITVIFAVLIAAGCSEKNHSAEASGENHTIQVTKEYVADVDANGTEVMTGTKETSVTESEDTYTEGQTENENAAVDGQTVPEEAQTDKKGETMTGGEEQQTKPSAAKPGTTTTQPETEAPTKAPAQSTVKPGTPVQPETQAPTKTPEQSTPKPTAPVQPETQAPTKAPSQTTVKPSVPAQSETQAPTKAPEQSTPKPTTPAQPETQAPTKAPETPKEKTMWDAPYDVEAIKAYMVAELKSRGYIDWTDYEATKEFYRESSKKYGYEYELGYDEWKESILPASPFGENLRAWDNFCTATAGPNRYYDNINHCTVGHQHYNWSNPATGAGEKKNSEGLTSLEFYVNDALDYWCYMYGEGHMFPEEYREDGFSGFYIYIEKFDDGCVIFYILA